MRVFLTLNVLKNDYQKLLTILRNFQIEIDVFFVVSSILIVYDNFTRELLAP